jgi:hypothetical protein
MSVFEFRPGHGQVLKFLVILLPSSKFDGVGP